MKYPTGPASAFLLAGFLSCSAFAQQSTEALDTWAYDSIYLPASDGGGEQVKPVVVAVVDDAFRLSHKELKDFVYRNPIEIPGNHLDDDGNNCTDDIHGWDIPDNDNDVSPPEDQRQVFYHGTYVSSIITKIASLYYGEAASNRIKIMPVKVLADQASRTYIKEGYKGIAYAMENGADIICLAWSGGNPGDKDLQILREANAKGILLVGSAGNFNEEKVLFPAADPAVIAVAGLDRELQKEKRSNYGMQVDISAPAEYVPGAHPDEDNAYIHDQGTSASAALVAGCAAILLSKNRDLQNTEVKEALMNASVPFRDPLSAYGGKLGAGKLHLENALDYLEEAGKVQDHFSPLRSKGVVIMNPGSTKNTWEISPQGAYHGLYLEPDISHIRKAQKHSLSIVVSDTVWNSYNLSQIPGQIFVPAPSLKLKISNASFRNKDILKIGFRGKTIDSARLYCSGTQYLNLESGNIEDGSGESKYANNCSCRWIITVPHGKRIKFTFDRMDTEENVDFVYLVDGNTAIPENFIAKFSGQIIPPVVVSRTNEVLVWFVTDKATTGQGWQLHYELFEQGLHKPLIR